MSASIPFFFNSLLTSSRDNEQLVPIIISSIGHILFFNQGNSQCITTLSFTSDIPHSELLFYHPMDNKLFLPLVHPEMSDFL